MISRRKNFVALCEDEEEVREEERPKSYCERCDNEFGVKALLGPRIMEINDKGEPEAKPSDYDLFLQCRGCGSMYRKEELKVEAQLIDVVEPNEDKKSEITAVYSRGRGTGTKRLKEKQKKRKEQLDSITDEDIKTEIRKGGKVTIQEDTSTNQTRVFDYYTDYEYYY